jgi:RNA polymerase sigma-70 factor, ECF subfamily
VGDQDGLPTGRTVTAYTFGIAQHKMADAMRASARLAVPVSELPDIADARPGPEETVLARWEGEQVRRALAQLPPPQRRLLQLRVVSGLTTAGNLRDRLDHWASTRPGDHFCA